MNVNEMICLKILGCLILLTATSQAAIHILIEPSGPDTSVFTVTETGSNPLIDLTGISGYSMGMELPKSMFNIPDFPSFGGDDSPISPIYGELTSSVATVSEIFSGQSFRLDRIIIPFNSSPSLLLFSSLFTGGGTSVRFRATSLGPVVTNISFQALSPGVHHIDSFFFESVTVTVVPEPSTFTFIAAACLPLLLRRRKMVK
jgi:hypothetical protein